MEQKGIPSGSTFAPEPTPPPGPGLLLRPWEGFPVPQAAEEGLEGHPGTARLSRARRSSGQSAGTPPNIGDLFHKGRWVEEANNLLPRSGSPGGMSALHPNR